MLLSRRLDHSSSLTRPAPGPFFAVGFALKFLLGFALLYFVLEATRDTLAWRMLIEDATVRPAAALVNAFVPTEAVAAQGPALVSPRARLTVRGGCEGIEAMLLLAAAYLAAPLGWRVRLTGLAAGLGLIYALNQARLVALWFALRHDRELFSLLHGVIAPAVLVGAACAYFAWQIAPRAGR